MMSGISLETCSAFNERWNNKFYYKVTSCWLFLLSRTTMHGSMNIKNLGSFLIRKPFNYQFRRCLVDIIAASIFEVPGSYLCTHTGYFEKFRGLVQRIRSNNTWHLLLDTLILPLYVI